MELSEVNVIKETSFPRGWQKAAAFIEEEGIFRTIGGPKEGFPEVIERKEIIDTCQMLILLARPLLKLKKE